jgi:hypothetical protein
LKIGSPLLRIATLCSGQAVVPAIP